MQPEPLVSRAGAKLALALPHFNLDLKDKIILDVGSSTGGFTQVALREGARRVYAIEVGTKQLHPSLSTHPRVVSMEKTDVTKVAKLPDLADLALVDVSFVSLTRILPSLARLLKPRASIVALVKPQFEAKLTYPQALNRGIIKNNNWRRKILKAFEDWTLDKYLIQNKLDSAIEGTHGNLERFYLLQPKG